MTIEKGSVHPFDTELIKARETVERLPEGNRFRAHLLAALGELETPLSNEAREVEETIDEIKKAYQGRPLENLVSQLYWDDIEDALRKNLRLVASLIELKRKGQILDQLHGSPTRGPLMIGSAEQLYRLAVTPPELSSERMLALLEERFNKLWGNSKLSWEDIRASLVARPKELQQIIEREQSGDAIIMIHPSWGLLVFAGYYRGVRFSDEIKVEPSFTLPKGPLK